MIGLAARDLMLAACDGGNGTFRAMSVERLVVELEQLLPDRRELG